MKKLDRDENDVRKAFDTGRLRAIANREQLENLVETAKSRSPVGIQLAAFRKLLKGQELDVTRQAQPIRPATFD